MVLAGRGTSATFSAASLKSSRQMSLAGGRINSSPIVKGFSHSSVGKESACNSGDLGSIPGLGRSPGEGKTYPFQYSGLENSMDSPWSGKELDTTFTFLILAMQLAIENNSLITDILDEVVAFNNCFCSSC